MGKAIKVNTLLQQTFPVSQHQSMTTHSTTHFCILMIYFLFETFIQSFESTSGQILTIVKDNYAGEVVLLLRSEEATLTKFDLRGETWI